MSYRMHYLPVSVSISATVGDVNQTFEDLYINFILPHWEAEIQTTVQTDEVKADGEPSTTVPSLERCIFEQVIFNYTWFRHDIDF